MYNEKAKPSDTAHALVQKNGILSTDAKATGVYTIQCRDQEGNLKWEIDADNLVVNTGLQDMNAKYFTGSAYTAVWYLGLITGPASGITIAAGNTMASHAGWSEATGYSNATRPACTFGTPTTANPSVATNSASAATFNMNATATIAGAFLTTDNTKGGTTGTLYSAAAFSAPGDRSVVSGDTLTVIYTLSLAG